MKAVGRFSSAAPLQWCALMGTRLPIQSCSRRHQSSFASFALDNGLLEDTDTLYRTGMTTKCKFVLPAEFAAKLQASNREAVLKEVFEKYPADPFVFVQNDLQHLSRDISTVLGSDHPVLKSIARHFFDAAGKQFRPTILFCLSRALSVHHTGESIISAPQQRLAQITELIHTASLLHDDVLDDADKRRGVPSVNKMYGNKLAILGGDFLLARASVALARLRDPDVIEIMSTILEHLVKGEVMQYKPKVTNDLFENIDYYITKSFYKTASLISGSCKSTAKLNGYDAEIQEICWEYGKNLGLAFQVVDDLLDFEQSSSTLGKPSMADLSGGVVTAPVLYAAQEFPELRPMIDRKFSQPGDVDLALRLIQESSSLERARQLSLECGEKAVAAVLQLRPSDARSACIQLVHKVIHRKH
eukprot:gb/GEZN01008103.1/.p1 GENE.gb/GEZN01008103.1/~~gb/GEZN01008103.1/.p1  ORF type:complete len:416 (+),score=43.77 gb/GEZN01008103.1/:86-1333(+)